MEEVYKPIEGFPNYNVSNFGNVKNVNTNKILKPISTLKMYGYKCYCVILYNDTRATGYNLKIHQLVAKAFIPNSDNKPIIDHIDRNTANNHVTNLRWATHSENGMNSKTRSDNTVGERNLTYKADIDKYQVAVQGRYLGLFDTIEEATKARNEYLEGNYTAPVQVSSSAHKNIICKNERYRVEIQRNGIVFRQRCKTLEEAIKIRDDYLNSL